MPFHGLPGPESYRGRDGFVEFIRTAEALEALGLE
jgi:hypothetical protein